jgi:hypothetical protein
LSDIGFEGFAEQEELIFEMGLAGIEGVEEAVASEVAALAHGF